MSLFSGVISAPATPRGPLNPETPGASQLFVKVRSPFLSLPRGPWKEDSKSKYASSRPLMGGEDPGACCRGSASQVLVSLIFSRIRTVGSEMTCSSALNNFSRTSDVNTCYLLMVSSTLFFFFFFVLSLDWPAVTLNNVNMLILLSENMFSL